MVAGRFAVRIKPDYVFEVTELCRPLTGIPVACIIYSCLMPCPGFLRPCSLSSAPAPPRSFISGGGSRSLSLSELKPADVTASLRPGPPFKPASLKARCMAFASSAVTDEAVYFERIDFTAAFCCSVSDAPSPGRARASFITGAPCLSSRLWAGTAPEKRRHMPVAITIAKSIFFIALPFFVCRMYCSAVFMKSFTFLYVSQVLPSWSSIAQAQGR